MKRTAALGTLAIVIRPATRSPEAMLPIRDPSTSSTIRRNSGNTCYPAGVSLTLRLLRSSNGAPTACSSFWMRRLSAGCDSASCSAARWKLRMSDTAISARKSSSSKFMGAIAAAYRGEGFTQTVANCAGLARPKNDASL
jgi:hypothetical protein